MSAAAAESAIRAHSPAAVGLANKCKVLVLLHNEGAQTFREIAATTGLSDKQTETALRLLREEGKVIVIEERHSHQGGNIYAFNDEWVPHALPSAYQRRSPTAREKQNTARTANRRIEAVHKAVDIRVKGLPLYVRFRDRKLALLRKLLDAAGAHDRDTLLGIIADYERGAREEPAG